MVKFGESKNTEHFRCQSCDKDYGIFIKQELKDIDATYILCLNCLLLLVTTSLSSEYYFNLLANGHKSTEYYLHDDFYDEKTGLALQPKLR